jgi:hypothetical protein
MKNAVSQSSLWKKGLESTEMYLKNCDCFGVFNFVTKHHWKASNFVTPLQKDTKAEKVDFFGIFLIFKILYRVVYVAFLLVF